MQNIENARSQQQKEDMEKLAEANACLFCKEGLTLTNKRVLFKGTHLYITPNDFPYKGVVHHVMVVPKRHIITPEEMTSEEYEELFTVMLPWLRENLKMDGCSGLFRFGNTKRTGATINHFHIHFISGAEKESKDHEPIMTLVGYKNTQPASQP